MAMKKSDLAKLPELRATKTIKQLAKEDKPQKVKTYGWTRIVYQHGLYMRCHILGDVIKVAIFLTEHVRAGAFAPAYEVYVSKKERKFITYDRVNGNWLSAKLDKILWPNYCANANSKWISRADNAAIRRFLGNRNGDAYNVLLRYQQDIRHDELMARHRLETDRWDEDLFVNTPKVPKDWDRWVSKVGIPDNFIFYEYTKRGARTGFCTYCEKDVPIKKPRHLKQGRCPCCRREITYRSVGKASVASTEGVCFYLMQRSRDGFIIREFAGYRRYFREKYRDAEVHCWEKRRAIFDKTAKALRAYVWDMYKNSYHRWVRCGVCSYSWRGDERGAVYGKTLPGLNRKELHGTGLMEAASQLPQLDPELYLAILAKVPTLEKIAKANLPRLTWDCLTSYYGIDQSLRGEVTGGLACILGISAIGLKRIRQNNGGFKYLDWMRAEHQTGNVISDDTIMWFIREGIEPDKIAFILDRMSALQVQHFIQRQMSENEISSKKVLETWRDYLSMAEKLNMDTGDSIIFRARKLFQRHDELVERIRTMEEEMRIETIQETFPHVDAICQSLAARYEYADKDFAIVAPTGVADIVAEGDNLHHCVDKSGRYWDRIERRESYVLFLRKTADVNTSYYTLEVEPNGTIRQKRTMYDRQNADIDEAMKFLGKWQKVIATRITAEDRKLAEKSRELRVIEFEQMRRDCVVIPVGDLQGVPLADVLMADLMEAA